MQPPHAPGGAGDPQPLLVRNWPPCLCWSDPRCLEIVVLQGAPVAAAAAAAAAAAQPHEAGILGARVGDYLAWQMASLPLCRPSGSGAHPLGTGVCPVQHRTGSQSGCRPSSGRGPQTRLPICRRRPRLPHCPSGPGCRSSSLWRSTAGSSPTRSARPLHCRGGPRQR